jgi:hypothetical protein
MAPRFNAGHPLRVLAEAWTPGAARRAIVTDCERMSTFGSTMRRLKVP